MPLGRLEFDDLIILVAHPMPPARAGLTQENPIYHETVAKLALGTAKPVIIVSDLNNTLWSHHVTPILKARLQWPQGSGLAYGWPNGRVYRAIQIDHTLTKGAVARSYQVLGPIGSDHFPVRAKLDFSKNAWPS